VRPYGEEKEDFAKKDATRAKKDEKEAEAAGGMLTAGRRRLTPGLRS